MIVTKGSPSSEMNPLARFLMIKLGVLKGILYLKSVIIIVTVLMYYYYIFRPFTMIIVLICANLFYAVVLINNMIVYRKVKKVASKHCN